MKRYLLRLSLLLMISTIATITRAGGYDIDVYGVYLTYEDFQNGNLLKSDKNKFSYSEKKLSITVNGEKRDYKLKDVWGVIVSGELLRFIPVEDSPIEGVYWDAQLISAGELCLWVHGIQTNSRSTTHDYYYLTKGINGRAYFMLHRDELESAVNKEEAFQPLLTCTDDKKAKESVFTAYVQGCLSQQPGYIADRKSVVNTTGKPAPVTETPSNH